MKYYGVIALGSPPRELALQSSWLGLSQANVSTDTFNVILDTGSSDLWLAGSECTSHSGCEDQVPLYDSTISASVQLKNVSTPTEGSQPAGFNVSYGSGEASGRLVSDTVEMAGYSVTNQTFASIQHVTDGLLEGNVSGIMGLGFQSIAASQAMPFWQSIAANYSTSSTSSSASPSLADSGSLTNGTKNESFEMGFALTRFLHDPSSPTHKMPGGSMAFGKRNESLFKGDVFWNNLTETGYWMIRMDDVKVGNSSMGVKSKLVAIDT